MDSIELITKDAEELKAFMEKRFGPAENPNFENDSDIAEMILFEEKFSKIVHRFFAQVEKDSIPPFMKKILKNIVFAMIDEIPEFSKRFDEYR